MSIVLNEYEWAERMINNHDLGKRPVETLNRVAKYYLATGYSKREVRVRPMVIPLGNRIPILRYAQERKSKPAELLAVQLFDGLHLFTSCAIEVKTRQNVNAVMRRRNALRCSARLHLFTRNINTIHSNDRVLIHIFGYLVQHI